MHSNFSEDELEISTLASDNTFLFDSLNIETSFNSMESLHQTTIESKNASYVMEVLKTKGIEVERVSVSEGIESKKNLQMNIFTGKIDGLNSKLKSSGLKFRTLKAVSTDHKTAFKSKSLLPVLSCLGRDEKEKKILIGKVFVTPEDLKRMYSELSQYTDHYYEQGNREKVDGLLVLFGNCEYFERIFNELAQELPDDMNEFNSLYVIQIPDSAEFRKLLQENLRLEAKISRMEAEFSNFKKEFTRENEQFKE